MSIKPNYRYVIIRLGDKGGYNMKTLLLYNPNSGTGKILKKVKKVEKHFTTKGWQLDTYASKSREDLIDAAYRNAHQYDRYILMGGDGTMSLSMKGIMKSKVRPKVLTIPTGTANDFSYIMGIKRFKIKQTLKLLDHNVTRKTDIYMVNQNYFIYAGAIGKFSEVSYDVKNGAKKRLGHLAYMIRGLKSIPKKVEFDIKIETEDKTYEMKSFLVFLLAGKRVAGFNFKKLNKDIKLNDGKLELIAFKRNSVFSWFKIFYFYFSRGKVFKSDLKMTIKEAKIEVIGNHQWNFDGEVENNETQHIKVCKEAVEMYVTPKSEKIYY